LRLPAFAAGIAGFCIMIMLARRWLEQPGWLWATGFCALSSHCVNHGVEVRPYAADFLMTVTILLLAHGYMTAASSQRLVWWATGLVLASVLAPWLSFPCAFVLIASNLAILLQCLHRKSPRRFLFWLILTGFQVSAFILVWIVQARHLYYPGLKEEWTLVWVGFPREYSFVSLLGWTWHALQGAAHYAAPGLGIPILLLGCLGLWRSWGRSRKEFLLLVGPLALTFLASIAGKYPCAGRTVFFLMPCFFLLAVEGLLYLRHRLPVVAAGAVSLLVMGMLAPGLINTAKSCVRVQPMMEYREALAFVESHRGPEDAVWNWCPELNKVYLEHIFQCPRKCTFDDPQDASGAVGVALLRPLWVIAPDNIIGSMVEPLGSLPIRPTMSQQFQGVKVLRFNLIQEEEALGKKAPERCGPASWPMQNTESISAP
jgi:hypothetical protein